MQPNFKDITIIEIASYICDQLLKIGIKTTLSGGFCVEVYSFGEYTSMVLVAGFVIFCFSDFGGTKALGWLTSLTLVVSTFTNLILLPALIKTFIKQQ